jgi:peroxiredoxin
MTDPQPAPLDDDPTASDGDTGGLIGPFTLRHLLALGGTIGLAAIVLVVLTIPISAPAPPEAEGPGAGFYRLGDDDGTGLAVGDRPPPLGADAGALLDLDGDAIDLADYEGRPVWIVFWASWCPPCITETPDLQRAYAASAGTGLELVGVNVQETADIAREFATKYGVTYRIAIDATGGAFQRWQVFGLPTHYFIGRDGRIADRWFGPLSLDEMQQRIDRIVEEM